MPQQSYWPARLILFLGISAFAPASVAQYSVLHSFAEETGDGWFPYSGLTVAGSTIYGTTFDGGANDGGTIYKLNTDGTAYGVLHSFNGGTTGVGGSRPDAGLTLSGSTLYGTTRQGGAHWSGTLYSINNDGTGFRVLHSFSDNNHPNTRPTFSGTTLYGTTWSTWGGIIYKTNVDGTGYVPLHAFDTERQGGLPQTDLLMSGSTLYGMTSTGGTGQGGTVFKMNTNNLQLSLLRSFPLGSNSDGQNPEGGLLLIGSTLYGTTSYGGVNDGGTLFTMKTDGSGFTILHNFSGGSQGFRPRGGVILVGSSLFGTTNGGGAYGGDFGSGTVYGINLDGNGFSIIHSFGSSPTDGKYPIGDLTLSGSKLYGVTQSGGTRGYGGTVYAISVGAVEPPGDFNSDGAVDTADYVAWRKNNGTQIGYDAWRANFGRTTDGGNGAGDSRSEFAVPEPCSNMLVLLAVTIAALGRRPCPVIKFVNTTFAN